MIRVEGRLTIDLERGAPGAARARLDSGRPLGLTRAFTGRTVKDAVGTLPLLFNVCALAQGAASAEAGEQAVGTGTCEQTRRARRLLVLAETAREHLICMVDGWARILGESRCQADLLRAMRQFEDLRKAIDPERRVLSFGANLDLDASAVRLSIHDTADAIAELALGEAIPTFLARETAADFDTWQLAERSIAQRLARRVSQRGWSAAGNCATQFLPRLDDQVLAEKLFGAESDDFVRRPSLDGAPHETGTLARQLETPLVRDLVRHHGHGILPRLAARLVEIARLPDSMLHVMSAPNAADNDDMFCAASPAHGRGLAQIEAARGRLIHGVQTNGDVVARYAILAPTEWNFQSEGSAGRGLLEIAAKEQDVHEIADLFVSLLDPCIGYDVRVH